MASLLTVRLRDNLSCDALPLFFQRTILTKHENMDDLQTIGNNKQLDSNKTWPCGWPVLSYNHLFVYIHFTRVWTFARHMVTSLSGQCPWPSPYSPYTLTLGRSKFIVHCDGRRLRMDLSQARLSKTRLRGRHGHEDNWPPGPQRQELLCAVL